MANSALIRRSAQVIGGSHIEICFKFNRAELILDATSLQTYLDKHGVKWLTNKIFTIHLIGMLPYEPQ